MNEVFLAFLGGILASLTPCVYPMIPITISFISGQAKSKLHAAQLSCLYVLGMVLMYTALGIFAGFTGKIFGKITMNPTVYFTVGSIIIFFGLVQLGVIRFKISYTIFNRILSMGGVSALFMGITSGFVAAPCTAPILGAILTYIASHQSIVFGALLMLSFSLGLGLLFLFLGIFSGFLSSLPKSGQWLLAIEKISGIALILIGGYYIYLAAR